MEQEKGKAPDALPDEALDEAAGGVTFGGSLAGDTAAPSVQSGVTTESKTAFPGFQGGVTVAAGDVNGDAARKIADGSVKPSP